jgi:hypothetical protein
MEVWSDEALRAYFRDPVILEYEVGAPSVVGGIAKAGWYVLPYCDPGCCPPHGPFGSVEAARKWSIENMEQLVIWSKNVSDSNAPAIPSP